MRYILVYAEGFKKQYEYDSDFALQMSHLPPLVFVPEAFEVPM
jgi:hypothetical protein